MSAGLPTALRNHRPNAGSGAAVRRLRVAHWLHALEVGGTELNAVRLLERLDPGRFEPVLYVLRHEGPLVARVTTLGIPVREIHVGSLRGPGLVRAVRRAARAMQADGIDVVHCHDRYANVVGALAARLAGLRALITSKRFWVWPPYFGLANRLAFRLSARVLGNSASVARTLHEQDGVPDDRLIVVHNFLDEDAFAEWPSGAIAAERRALGVPEDALVVGIVARLAAVKHHELLLRAVGSLGRGDVHVLVVGDGDRLPALRQLAAALGIERRTHFVGYRAQHANIHRLFDVSALCSHHEGFPNTVIEAMAAGRPVVATDVGGVRDAVDDGVTGLLVPAGDEPAFAAALGSLLGDPQRRAAMGAAGAQAARSQFHVAQVVPELERLYERLQAEWPVRRAAH